MSNQFKDDKMEYIEDDIQKIQMKTGMYISYVGVKGALHLCKEVIQNAIDECANPKSPAKNIYIKLDKLDDTLTVEDDGRGIPEDDISMEILCTKLNSGSKFTREQGGASSGENGVGNTAVNALSDIFIWESYRDKKMHRLVFESGIKKEDVIKKSSKEHGCILKFSPSKKYLGKTAKINKNMLLEWIENISYFLPDKCKIKFEVWNGLTLEDSFKYKSKSLSELLDSKSTGEELSNTISISNRTDLVENFQGERDIKRHLSLDVAFKYTDAIEPYIDSYCNYVNTTSGGVHLDAVKEALWRYLSKRTMDTMSDKEKEKYKILKIDVETGLNLVVNIFTDYQIQFVGQTKNEVSNDNLFEPIRRMCIESLGYLGMDKNVFNTITKIIKTNCKTRIEAQKLKSIKVKSVQNKFEEHLMDNFTPCNNSGKAYKELHICEGKSASGSLVDGRDPDTQAFLSFRGVVRNGFKATEATILENKEWAQYIKIIGTGFGPNFNINKCNYDKIIIETDADVDGMGISSGICAFHALYLPELVKAGKLYKAVAPLYRLDDKHNEFVRDKREFVEVYEDKIIKNFNIIVPTISDKDLKKDMFRELLYETQEYSEELIRLSKHFGVNKFLIELVAYLILSRNKPYDEKITLSDMEKIQKKFEEITLKGDHMLRGIINGKFQSISINDRFLSKVSRLRDIFNKYGYKIKVKQKGESKYTKMSLGEFLDISNKYRPKILARFKGLGEANSKDLWNTTLNPDTRMLIQLTLDDVERDLKILKKLHGQNKEDLEERKLMMSHYQISREDLDN